jgi:hypothetical protein
MKRFLLFSFASLSSWVLFVGCSSSSGGSNAVACDDAGLCTGGLVCQNGVCVQPPGSGGSGQGGSGQGGSGNTGTGGLPSGGSGGIPSGGSGGLPSGGSGGLPSGGTGGLPSGGTGGGGPGNCGDFPFAQPACGTCAETYCCSEMLGCSTGTSCLNLLACLQQYDCFNQPDPDACANANCSAYADGQTALQTFDSCVAGNCASACGGG